MSHESPWGEQETQYFYQLTPERILTALESVLDVRCTGRVFAHNSMENRVYELELDLDTDPSHPYDRARIVKFYRPGRWSEAQILEEHRFLQALQENDVPAVAPLTLKDGTSLARHQETGLFYCVFPKIGGRAPHELDPAMSEQVGRLLARMHNVGAAGEASHRVRLNGSTYGRQNLAALLGGGHIPLALEKDYSQMVEDICKFADPLFEKSEVIQIHGDCHLGNLLWGPEGPFWVDFDDSVLGPPVQDLWLMVLGRGEPFKQQLDQMLRAYEMMRAFDWDSLRLIEPLRALRMVHFHAWLAKRYGDPAFKRAFPDFGTERYWGQQVADLREQLGYLDRPGLW